MKTIISRAAGSSRIIVTFGTSCNLAYNDINIDSSKIVVQQRINGKIGIYFSKSFKAFEIYLDAPNETVNVAGVDYTDNTALKAAIDSILE